MIRATLAAIFFIISGFIFFVFWAVSTFIISTFYDTMEPIGKDQITGWMNPEYMNIINQLQPAFGVICALFFLVGILLLFAMRALASEDEYYYVK